NGKTIAVMGLGSVGYALCGHLHAEGARLLVYDINPEAVGRAVNDYGATQVSAGEILTSPCDIFSPCAMGAVLNVDNVKELKCAIVAGAANNVLVDIETGDALDRRDILYLPDYIINAGGVLNCGMEIVEGRYDKAAVDAGVDKIHETTLNIIKMAKDKGISTARAADEYAADIVSKG
ncbi:MAG: Glu/Leu/Phe/Val dehydrogenase family protein, partial [Kiritimatiellaeota bacterium]|nr:Glu/Leu/Phe/Val dehydrogenase family protein [Kiritimatiellota bacterium]